MELTFGEQIKIILNRENKTIKEFAELTETQTGQSCSRQNLTQKLKRDNFQEQDMRMLAAVLGYKVRITLEPASPEEIAEELETLTPLTPAQEAELMSVLGGHLNFSQKESSVKVPQHTGNEKESSVCAPQTLTSQKDGTKKSIKGTPSVPLAKSSSPHKKSPAASKEIARQSSKPATASQPPQDLSQDPMESMLKEARSFAAAVQKKPEAQGSSVSGEGAQVPDPGLPADCINPYNGREYLTNTVRRHPELAHYIQVYDQLEHGWVDVAEDFFLRFQEQKRQMMGKDYSQPIYI